MAPRKTKASEQPVGEAPAKVTKKNQASEELTDVGRVCAAIRECTAAHCSAEARTVLQQALPHAASTAGPRHAYQDEMLALAGKVLRADVQTAKESEKEKNDRVQEVDQELEHVEAASAGATEAVKASRVAAADRSNELRALTSKIKEAQDNQAEAEKAVQPVVDQQAASENEKKKVASISDLQASAAALGFGELSRVTSYLEEIQAERALIAAVPGALGRQPSDRGRFDKITVESLEEVLTAKVNQMDEQIAELVPTLEEVTAMALGMWAIYDVTCDKRKAAAAASQAADTAAEDACTQAGEKSKEVEEQTSLAQKIRAEQAAESANLEKIQRSVEALERVVAGAGAPEEKSDEASPTRSLPDVIEKLSGGFPLIIDAPRVGA